MPNQDSDNLSVIAQRQRSLARWDDDGGREPFASLDELPLSERTGVALNDAELVNMRVRIIALENLLIALLVKAPASQVELAVEMAGYISPREGFTPHPLTISAAAHMKDLVERAASYHAGHAGILDRSEG